MCNAGELEFDEFVLILTTKLGVGQQQQQSSWQELADDTWALDVGQGGSIGAAALMQGLVGTLEQQLLRNRLWKCYEQPVHVCASVPGRVRAFAVSIEQGQRAASGQCHAHACVK